MVDEHTTIPELKESQEPGDRSLLHSPVSPSSNRSALKIILIVKGVLLGITLGVLSYYYLQGDLTPEQLRQFTEALPNALFVPAYLFLPLIGFPINILLIASGMKYGFGLAIGLAAVGMGFHTFACWKLAHSLFRRRLIAWLEGTRFAVPMIPHQHQIWFTSVFVTVPGLPYAVKLYSLALTNLPFRRYLLIVWIVHLLNAIPCIGIGIAAIQIHPGLLALFGLLALGMLAGSYWLKNRFSRELADSENPGSL